MTRATQAAKLNYGVGINDTGLTTEKLLNGVVTRCPFYVKWRSMIERGYSKKLKDKYPNYTDVGVIEPWHKLSNFKYWMQNQVWEGLELDKDILVKGNKIYGPDVCCFVPLRLNTCIALGSGGKTKYPFGVTKKSNFKNMINGHSRPYIAVISTTLNGKNGRRNVGYSDTAFGAHKIWQLEKANAIEETVVWYATQNCFRTDVADALTARVWQLRLENSLGIETVSL